MERTGFMTAADVVKAIGVSNAQAYKMIKNLNKELESKGYIVIRGKVSKQYFYERVYCGKES